MLRKIFVLIAIASCSFWVGANDRNISEKSKEKQERKGNLVKKLLMLESRYSKFDISGVIIDDSGNPINAVELEFNFSRAKGWKNERLNKKVVSESEFSIMQSGYTGVTVYFRKKGYFPETRFYGTQLPSKYLKNNTYSKTDEKIVLREIGKRAKFKKFEKLLKYNLEKKESSFCDLSGMSYKTLSLANTMKTEKYIYLDFERDKNGEIAMIETKYNGIIPKNLIVRYISRDKKDGFIIEETVKNLTYLTRAPDTSYTVKEISIPYKSEDIYFYYKNGNSFGKGSLASPQTSYGESCVWLRLMQNVEKDENEKRNLRSLDY